MTADTGTRSVYLDDFSDEVMPCEPTLDAWAEWLSGPDAEWGRDTAATDGETFAASVLRWDEDIIATRQADGTWTLSREVPARPGLLAIRFGPGLGWDADSMVQGADGILDWLRENDSRADQVEHVAVGIEEPGLLLTYRTNPPRLVAEQA